MMMIIMPIIMIKRIRRKKQEEGEEEQQKEEEEDKDEIIDLNTRLELVCGRGHINSAVALLLRGALVTQESIKKTISGAAPQSCSYGNQPRPPAPRLELLKILLKYNEEQKDRYIVKPKEVALFIDNCLESEFYAGALLLMDHFGEIDYRGTIFVELIGAIWYGELSNLIETICGSVNNKKDSILVLGRFTSLIDTLMMDLMN